MDNQAFSLDEDEAPTGTESSATGHGRIVPCANTRHSINAIGKSSKRTSRSSTSSSICSTTGTVYSESSPINIHRPILYSDDLYQNRCWTINHDHQHEQQLTTSTEHFQAEHSNRTSNLFSLGSLKSVSKRLLPTGNSGQTLSFWSLVQTVVPILNWLPNYKVKEDLLSDLIAGVTVLALHIPQGLAYGRLAGVEPINGLYVSLFPVIIYALLGTSRQVSIGTFAVISIACRDVVESFEFEIEGSTQNETIRITGAEMLRNTPNPLDIDYPVKPIDVLIALCLFVGIIQFVLGILQMGILAILLPNTLISGFVVACSIHVFTSQIFALIGIESSSEEDYVLPIPFEIVLTYINIFRKIPQINLATLLISVIAMSLLVMCKYGLEPFLVRKFHLKNIALPIDIIVIIVVTVISGQMNWHERYKVDIIPEISTGFTGLPTIPKLEYFSKLYTSAILIAFVSYVSSFSLGKMYAKSHGYEVDANQELIALGAANIFSSFFLCYPCAGSLARSAVQDKVGGRTQLTTIVSSVLLVVFLLYFSSYLAALPKCILSSIIIVALYSTMKRFSEFLDAWRFSKLDGILWLCTFILVVLFGVGHGLLLSVIISFVILIFRLSIPIIKLKRRVPNSEVYVEVTPTKGDADTSSSSASLCTLGTVVFDFQGPLIFLNVSLFKSKFQQLIGCHLSEWTRGRTMQANQQTALANSSGKSGLLQPQQSTPRPPVTTLHTVIFDCSRVLYVDQKGVETLLELQQQLHEYQIQLMIGACSETVYRNMVKCRFFDKFNPKQLHASVHDAFVDATTTATKF